MYGVQWYGPSRVIYLYEGFGRLSSLPGASLDASRGSGETLTHKAVETKPIAALEYKIERHLLPQVQLYGRFTH